MWHRKAAETKAESVAAESGPTPEISDEGVPFEWRDPQTIINAAPDASWYDQRRVRLHVGGKTFEHVADEGARRVYRHDR
ncbi:MAG: hypothetical protein ACREJC_17250 [Tepidisphaeraceae bacterium]